MPPQVTAKMEAVDGRETFFKAYNLKLYAEGNKLKEQLAKLTAHVKNLVKKLDSPKPGKADDNNNNDSQNDDNNTECQNDQETVQPSGTEGTADLPAHNTRDKNQLKSKAPMTPKPAINLAKVVNLGGKAVLKQLKARVQESIKSRSSSSFQPCCTHQRPQATIQPKPRVVYFANIPRARFP